MDYDGTKQKYRQPFLIDNVACTVISERNDNMFFMRHNLLSFITQTFLRKDWNIVIFSNNCLENREIRINTHTHTQGLARQDITKYLITKGLPGTILSGYPRCSIIIYQKYSVPPCFSEQGGTELLSGGIRSAGFPCPSAAVFFRAAFQQRPRHSLNLK